MKCKPVWENMVTEEWGCNGCDTSRMRVIGGWIVKYTDKYSDEITSSMVFVPDLSHQWEIK